MQETTVSYTNLAPLFLLDRSFEEKPDPFRLQGDKVMFVIPYNEYKLFIDKCLGEVDYLATPTKLLKEYLNTRDEIQLYRSYMREVAIAIGKELFYAEEANKSASHYQHRSDGSLTYTREDIYGIYKYIDTEKVFRGYMESHDFKLPKYFKSENQDLWFYANVLYFFSNSVSVQWEVTANDR